MSRSPKASSRQLFPRWILPVLLVGCSSDPNPNDAQRPVDSGDPEVTVVDSGSDTTAPADSGTVDDATPETGDDAAPDAILDTAPDAILDTAPDAVVDTAPDAVVDVPFDLGGDASCPPCGARSVCVGGSCVPARRVFASSRQSTGNLGGLAGADAICNSLATAASLGGTWKAWLSSSTTTASARLEHATVAYRLVNGTVVANNWTDLTDGTLARAIDRTEANVLLPTPNEVWTGTMANGTGTGGCVDFTSANPMSTTPYIGITNAADSTWTTRYLQFCDRANVRLYCFEQ